MSLPVYLPAHNLTIFEVCCFSCLQIARAFGASDIIAVDVQDDKLEKAKTLGATHIVNAAKEDAVDRIRVCMVY